MAHNNGVQRFLLTLLACLSISWAQSHLQPPPADRVDVGWIAVVREDQGWRVIQVEGLLESVKGSVARSRQSNLRVGDELLSLDGQDLSELGPLGVAALLEDLAFLDVRIELRRRGDRYLVKPFADRAAHDTSSQPKFSLDQLPKRGSPAPDFTLADLDGEQFTLTSLRGRWVLLNF